MRIDELLEDIDSLDLSNLYPDMEVTHVTCDSRKVTPGSMFVAIPGTRVDGHEFISQALAAGATLVVQSSPIEPGAVGSFLRVADTREAYAALCARLAGSPSRALRVIGITGTNGKTSTALIARHLLECSGRKAAALGTLGLLKPGARAFVERDLTTPDPAKLQRIFRELADSGTTHVLMEVTSHALSQHRVVGVDFAGGVFTNLSQDHLDYHPTIKEYSAAKETLFSRHLALSGGYAVINADDPVGRQIADRFAGMAVLYGSEETNNLVVTGVTTGPSGLAWKLLVKNGVWPPSIDGGVNRIRLECPLVGRYNVANCTAAAGIALLEGLTLDQVASGLQSFDGVPGRLQRVENARGVNVFVDYAHTPAALENVLDALAETRSAGVRIITVVGCGGDRDREKRPLMGAAAQSRSDLLVVTSDNPRSEEPHAIIDEILSGVSEAGCPVLSEVDRRAAIRLALSEAKAGDIVLIAGKGHEDYQILATETVRFSDVEEVRAYFDQGS